MSRYLLLRPVDHILADMPDMAYPGYELFQLPEETARKTEVLEEMSESCLQNVISDPGRPRRPQNVSKTAKIM